MRYTKKTVKESTERNIITAMITSTEFIKQILPVINISLFDTIYGKIISKWCLDFFETSKESPKEHIQAIFENNKDQLEDNVIESIEQFLIGIDNKNQNIPYLVDQTEKYLNLRKLEKINNELNILINNENTEDGIKLLNKFKPIQRPTGDGIDVFDKEKVLSVLFNDNLEFLFRFKGDLGQLLHDFNRSDFVAFLGPGKRGKTFWLLETAKQALRNSLNVLFISLEMSEKSVLKRFYTMLTGRTFKRNEEGIIIDVPYFDNKRIDTKEHKIKLADEKYLDSKIEQILRGKMRGGRLWIYTASSSSINTVELNNYIDLLEQENNFIPDVIIIDYADLMSTPYRYAKEGRERIDQIWKGLRAIAQDRHCLVVTASHSNKATFLRDIEEGDPSEDIRKINHVTGAIALNQTRNEKEKGIMRMGLLYHRFEECNPGNEVVVLEQRKIGRVNIDSRWKKNVIGL